MNYSESDIKKTVGVQTFIKGKEYYRYGMVLQCSAEVDNETNILLHSKTRGNHGHNYTQSVQLYKTPSSIRLHGTCTCPIVFNCKHVTAVALHYLNVPKVIDPLAEMERWIDTVKYAAKIPQEEPKKGLMTIF